MKSLISLIIAFTTILFQTACGTTALPDETTTGTTPETTVGEMTSAAPDETSGASIETTDSKGAIVVYFSATGNTKALAEKIAGLADADLFELVPEEPYTSADLNYSNDDCRANREMNDPDARPAISELPDLSGYDKVFIGFPIWWGTMPRIINTFLDSADLSGKTVLPFCTSGGSGISTAVSDIKKVIPDVTVEDGLRSSASNEKAINDWLDNN